MKTSRRRLDVNVEELDRVIDAAENGPLSKADCQKLKTTLHALVERLAPKRNTEKTNSVLEPKNSSSAATESPEPAAPAGHGRNAASAFTGAEKVSVQHAQLKPGDPCPECREGRVYRQKEPKTLIRIVGQAPLKATVFEMERLRCNGCCQVFTAAEPPGVGTDKYDTTAVAMIALLKYGTGVPFNRMERLETQLGIPLPAATQWELMEAAAKQLKRILDEFIRQAAQGGVVHNDDTGMRILKLVRNTGRRAHGNLHQRHRIDLAGVADRAVLYRLEACGRESRRCSEATRGRSWMRRFRCAMRYRGTRRSCGYRNPAGQLPGARKAAVVRRCRELPRRMPVCAGVAGRGIRLRRRSERARPDAGGKADVSSVEQRAGDGRSAPVDGESVCGAQDRTELRAGQGNLLLAAALDETDTVPAAGRARHSTTTSPKER